MSIVNWEDSQMVDSIQNNHLLYIVTGQISQIKTIFETIKDIVLEDINITFTKDFITVIKQNSNKTSMIHLKLESEFFEYYHLTEQELTIGVNSINFYKIIKTAKNNDDTITFYIKKNQNKNILVIKIENDNKNTVSEDELVILDFIEEAPCIPDDVEYPGSIIAISNEFQRVFRNIKTKNPKRHNKEVEIIHVDNQLTFKYKGEFSNQKITLGESRILKEGNKIYEAGYKKDTVYETSDNEIIQGIFNVDYLLIFAKATNLNSTMLIRIQNDMPLILEFKVGILGRLHLLLNPIY